MKPCSRCNGTGVIEIMGDGANFEWDVIDTKPCEPCGGTGLVDEDFDQEDDYEEDI